MVHLEKKMNVPESRSKSKAVERKKGENRIPNRPGKL